MNEDLQGKNPCRRLSTIRLTDASSCDLFSLMAWAYATHRGTTRLAALQLPNAELQKWLRGAARKLRKDKLVALEAIRFQMGLLNDADLSELQTMAAAELSRPTTT